jgi:hypothetical protein
MIDIDDNVKLSGVGTKARAKHHAKNVGSFVRAGTSLAPSDPPKIKAKGWGKPTPKTVESAEPLYSFLRKLNTSKATLRARDLARSVGIPSTDMKSFAR